MSKSRSSDEKDREKEKEKEVDSEAEENEADSEKEAAKDAGKERNRHDGYDAGDNAKGAKVPLSVNQLQLATEPESNLKPPVFDSNSLMVRNEPAIPSFPPPSYEHVIEQVRIWVIVGE